MNAAADRNANQFAGLMYIGQDGLEQDISDIPTLATYIRGGDITGSTLIRKDNTEPWRHAETDPNIAALLTLAGLRTAQKTPVAKFANQAARTSAKAGFLFMMLVIAVAAGLFIGELNSQAVAELFGYRLGRSTVSFPTVLMVFIPAILAVRNQTFEFTAKAKRFGLSMLLVLAVLLILPLVGEILFFLFPPVEWWPVIGLWIAFGIIGWWIVLDGLKRIWALSSIGDPFLIWRVRRTPPAHVPHWLAFMAASVLWITVSGLILRPDLSLRIIEKPWLVYTGGALNSEASLIIFLFCLLAPVLVLLRRL